MIAVYYGLFLFLAAYLASCMPETFSAASRNHLRIGSFNAHIFGERKTLVHQGRVLSVIAKIVCQFDVISIQEIRDRDQYSTAQLLDEVHTTGCPAEKYGFRLSPRSGRSTSKEQIAFFFRLDKVSVVGTKVIEWKSFERTPFMGFFRSRVNPDFVFAYLAAHLSPKNVLEETNRLHAAQKSLLSRFDGELKAAFIMGDLNADGTYLNWDARKDELHLTPDKYFWLIPSGVRTNTATKPYAYDRIVIDKSYIRFVEPKSVASHIFSANDPDLGDIPWPSVSDHYPIGMKLNINPDFADQRTTMASRYTQANIHLHFLDPATLARLRGTSVEESGRLNFADIIRDFDALVSGDSSEDSAFESAGLPDSAALDLSFADAKGGPNEQFNQEYLPE